MPVNREVLIEAVNWAIAENEKRARGEKSDWDQTEWICGSVCCIAGHVVLNAGMKQVGMFGCYVSDADDLIVKTPTAACELIAPGENPNFCESLFDGSNKIEDIKRIANQLLGEDYYV